MYCAGVGDGSTHVHSVRRRIFAVTKPELGIKRRCNSCETKFFDLNKDPIVCPKCLAVFTPPLQPDPARSRRPPERQASPARKAAVPKVPNEFVSPEGPSAGTETQSSTAEAEEHFLLDDQDETLDADAMAGVAKDDT